MNAQDETKLKQLRDTARQTVDQISSAAKTATTQIDAEVRSNPWRVIGIVALIAAVFGFLFGNRRSRD